MLPFYSCDDADLELLHELLLQECLEVRDVLLACRPTTMLDPGGQWRGKLRGPWPLQGDFTLAARISGGSGRVPMVLLQALPRLRLVLWIPDALRPLRCAGAHAPDLMDGKTPHRRPQATPRFSEPVPRRPLAPGSCHGAHPRPVLRRMVWLLVLGLRQVSSHRCGARVLDFTGPGGLRQDRRARPAWRRRQFGRIPAEVRADRRQCVDGPW
mmetsp:Transcript_26025/g.62046  ORF Transcript_26025/g.62046 Transcript_26025/m.62046 type:complete len:212 (-) Transcript_26025:550-1185(-)